MLGVMIDCSRNAVMNVQAVKRFVDVLEKMGYETLMLYTEDTGLTKSDLINYRNHPIDHVDVLVRNRIPVFLVAGDSDSVVPYVENGKVLYEYYVEHGGDITQIVKKGCDHHPHGLSDNALPKEFVNRVY